MRWIGRAAAQFARWNRQSDQFDFLVNELYPDALKLQADYWPAKYETGLLFLEKYNFADAAEEFRAALEHQSARGRNPRRLGPSVAGPARYRQGRERSRSGVGTQSASARCLAGEGRSSLGRISQVPETLELLEKNALPLNPQNEETLGRIAACYLLLDGNGEK